MVGEGWVVSFLDVQSIFLKLDNFHRRHLCIISKTLFTYHTTKARSDILQSRIRFFLSFFFSIWVFFHEYLRITGQNEKKETSSSTPFCHFHPLLRHLDISLVIDAKNSEPGTFGFLTEITNCLTLDVQGQGGRRILDVNRQER